MSPETLHARKGASPCRSNTAPMKPFSRTLRSGIVVMNTRPAHAPQLEQLQITVFPTLAETQLFRAPHYLKHIEIFPEGQFVALDGDRVVGMTTTVRLDLDRAHPDTFDDVICGGWCTAHDPLGLWMYGLDVGAHPDCRGRGVGRALYAARHEMARRLGMSGQATAGMLSGYGRLREQMTVEAYYDKVVSGEIRDPTVSAQMHVGFQPRGLIREYIDDPVCANCCVDLVLPIEIDVGADWADE